MSNEKTSESLNNPFKKLADEENSRMSFIESSTENSEVEQKLSKLFESIFQVTLDPDYANATNKCVYIGDAAGDTLLIRLQNLDEILLQRVMLTDRNQLEERVRPSLKSTSASSKTSKLELKCLETCQFAYLFDCFKRLNESKRHFTQHMSVFESACSLIINLCRTILNIFESYLDVSIINNNTSNKESIYYSVKSNQHAMSDLSIQFILLCMENIEENYYMLEQFCDRFLGLFEESETVRACMESKNDFTNVRVENDEQLLEMFKLDACELKFLSNVFVYLNKHFVTVRQCEDYSASYSKNLELCKFLTRQKLMKYLLIFYSFPKQETPLLPGGAAAPALNGRVWQISTLVGKLLTPNCLPLATEQQQNTTQAPQSPITSLAANLLAAGLGSPPLTLEYRYFSQPTQLTKRDIEINEKNIWQVQSLIKKEQNLFFFEHLIKKNSNRLIRDTWFKWLGGCMLANKAKTQEWLSYMQTNIYLNNNEHLGKFSSDGFLLNILDLLLDYSMPFCSSPYSNKLLKINFNYAVSKNNSNLNGLDKETKLISTTASNQLEDSNGKSDEFNFITECFYTTHSYMRLAYISLYQKLMKLNGELSRWQQTYQQLIENNRHQNDAQMTRLKQLYEQMTIEFLNVKSALLENDLLSKLVKFVCSTSSWLVYLAVYADTGYEQATLLNKLDDPSLIKNKSSEFNRNILGKLPEYFITNSVEFLIFLSRFKEAEIVDLFIENNKNIVHNEVTLFNNTNYSNLNALISLILVFMGDSSRLFNPHCRASLVEAVEIILPKKTSSPDYYNRKSLAYYVFGCHPCASFLTEALLNVFVSIEMTGQSVQFEQKFNYRRPMYELLEFLWNMPTLYDNDGYDQTILLQHRTKMAQLADDAYDNINNSEQPLFLKFLNLLINDANFLLLEGLLYLEKIKTLQEKLDHEQQQQQQQQQQQTQQQQRNESEANLNHMIMLAKFHNFMSTKTIQTIKMLTGHIKKIFCHDVLVDRIATMLNDFLLHLVGKKRRQFKVKNMEEVEFHPKEMVSNICDIYLNLGMEESFCKAVCRDGRSYSDDLFQQAKQVLEIINRDYSIIEAFSQLGKKLDEIYRVQQLEELNVDDAPDDYLDPIMSNLMQDPVMLPNSKKIVDRSTIARHLLSDQTDPFNRSPLTLQEVIPMPELKKQIEEWISAKRSKQQA